MAKVRIQVKRHSWRRINHWQVFRAMEWAKMRRMYPDMAPLHPPRFVIRVRKATPEELRQRMSPHATIAVWPTEVVKITPEMVEEWMTELFTRSPDK